MADPAGKTFAVSTSRRKRALPSATKQQQQSRVDSKRRRQHTQEILENSELPSSSATITATIPTGQQQQQRSDDRFNTTKSSVFTAPVASTSVQQNSNKTATTSGSNKRKHHYQHPSGVATSSSSSEAAIVQKHGKKQSSRYRETVKTSVSTTTHSKEFKADSAKKSKSIPTVSSIDNNRHKIDSNAPTTNSEQLKVSTSTSNSGNSSERVEEEKKRTTLPVASTSSESSTQKKSNIHKYKLRSRILPPSSSVHEEGFSCTTSVGGSTDLTSAVKTSTSTGKLIKKRGTRELVALGAQTSNEPTSEELVASRPTLTRSGAVLRRSTRATKGSTATTGSCASTSGASGSGTNNSRRTVRQHKVGSVTVVALPAPPSSHVAVTMATDHPDVNAVNAEDPPSPPEASQAFLPKVHTGQGVDSESDDSEVGRLQALLEARGLPPHLFGALGPRVQHFLHRSIGANSSVIRAQALIPGLLARGDEGQQLQAVIEMCQLLVMGNEEILTGFPVKQVVPALIALLGMEHNFDIMNHACRALTYMMEALPRSSSIVVDAVPVFLQKLQSIQCMDVAEQSLTALDMLSRRHSKSILHADGVTACLTYLDFFSINAQRNALSVTANCCFNLTPDEFQYVQNAFPLLASRLTQQDKKCVECVCLAFSRLVDSYQQESKRLQEIATVELLTNVQQLLVITPPVINTNTFITVLRMLSVMCANCSDLAVTLLKQNIADTLLYLLTGSSGGLTNEIELVARQPQEQFEITSLIGELMPKLPNHGVFSVDALLEKTVSSPRDQPMWQWRDDRGQWHNYSAIDNRFIETSHVNGDDDVSLNTLGRIYTIDFHSMQQINEDTGTTRPVQRRHSLATSDNNPDGSNSTECCTSTEQDSRVTYLSEDGGSPSTFIRSLFSVLYEVYSSSAGPAVRFKCLRALLRMVYYASPDLLKDVLKYQTVSSHLAGMMASSDLRIVVGALQMAEILMSKLADEFSMHFRREGVIHQIHRLGDPQVPLAVSPPKVPPASQPSTSSCSVPLSSSTSSSAIPILATTSNNADVVPVSSNSVVVITKQPDEPETVAVVSAATTTNNHVRLSDVLKRKRATKRTNVRSKPTTSHDDLPINSSIIQDLFAKTTTSLTSGTSSSTSANTSTYRSRIAGSSTSKTGFLQSLNPTRWGRSANSSHDRGYGSSKQNIANFTKSSSSSHITAGNKEKTRVWIRDQAAKFLERYVNKDNDQDPATSIMTRLKIAIEKLPTEKCLEALIELRTILIESDISPFEVNHSGLISAILQYLVDNDGLVARDQRLRIMLHVFADCSLDADSMNLNVALNSAMMSALVSKLNGCVSHLEQFPLRVHDFPAGSGVGGRGGALKFFSTHQLKCNLQRHPDCTNLKQWKGGTVKIDPLAMVQAIERYLILRGYGRVRDKDTVDSEDGDTDDDIDDTLANVVISQTGGRHKIQFLIGNNVLPYNMTVYQAVRQFNSAANDQSETDTDNETPLGNAGIWVQTHTIHYRDLKEEPNIPYRPNLAANVPMTRKGKGSGSKGVARKKNDELWNAGKTPPIQSILFRYLTIRLPETVTIQDASLEVLCLLRILNALNVHWSSLYTTINDYKHIIAPTEFVNSKIAAKASRQLQDPLVIMTCNLPDWLKQIAFACPFLFPFETRQLLFYVTSFDRDRALHRLLDMTPELSSADTSERVTPRLDRHKHTISRADILRQAEQIIQESASSKSLLEIQYENEVGTGLGPTLEFYALVSKELQKTLLEIWNAPNSNGEFVHTAAGLFPVPLARSAKVSLITKVKNKFRFLGKFIAKAVMDSRMLDLPFSLAFYRWLLGHETCLSLSDLQYVSPTMYKSLKEMHSLIQERDAILASSDLTAEEKTVKVEKLQFSGTSISDLDIDFLLPGYPVELLKNGKNTLVTIHNLHLYCNLVTHWILYEGVYRQMEALKEGFELVFPLRNLQLFQPEELEAVFCGSPLDSVIAWDTKTLMECCRPDHGYNQNSKAIEYLYEILSQYNCEEQRRFIQFITGSPRLPVGGFKALTPPLTIVRKAVEPNMNPDDYLPSVMTCVNYLKLPDYSSIEVMRNKLKVAASEGSHSFYLS